MKSDHKTYKLSRKHVNILGVRVDSTPRSSLLKEIQDKLAKRIRFYIVTPNPEIINQAQADPNLLEALNSSDFSIPDGFGLKLAAPFLQIVKGRELMLELFHLANLNKFKIYLLGSKAQVIKRSLEKIKKEFPGIAVRGNSGPILDKNGNPVSEVNSSLEFDVVHEINLFKPDLLFVGFGAPKQEKWIKKWMSKLSVIGMMVVGGSFDYYSGVARKVPRIFEMMGSEWLWRLIHEPKRIGRIFSALVLFPMRVILQGGLLKGRD